MAKQKKLSPAAPPPSRGTTDRTAPLRRRGGPPNTNDDSTLTVDDDSDADRMLLSKLAVLGDSLASLVAATIMLFLAVMFSYQASKGGDGGGSIYPWRRLNANIWTTMTTTTRSSEGTTVNRNAPMVSRAKSAVAPPPPLSLYPPDAQVGVEPLTVTADQIRHDATMMQALRALYQHDGVVAVRGLLPADTIAALHEDAVTLLPGPPPPPLSLSGRRAPRTNAQFALVHHGLLLEGRNVTHPRNAFYELATTGLVPYVAAHLLLNNTVEHNMRVLRDIYMTKDDGQYVCGWHVDDVGFWPVLPSFDGINAWVALDDMPAATGGGFALAVGSHVVDWQHHETWPPYPDDADDVPVDSGLEWLRRAHYVTGASTYFPAQGYQSAVDMLQRRPGLGTCRLEPAAPTLHAAMQRRMRVYELKAGDVIFHHRWLFHRTVPMVQPKPNQASSSSTSRPSKIYRRYSIRYNAGHAVVPPGYGTELSVLHNESWGGKSADTIVQQGGPYYPQAWPPPADDDDNGPAASDTDDDDDLARWRQNVRAAQVRYGDRVRELRQAMIMAKTSAL